MAKAEHAPPSKTKAPEEFFERAEAACDLLKAMAHPRRLAILCLLNAGPRSVSELEVLLNERQASVSQQLARLRLERLVTTEREGATIRYSLASQEARIVVEALYRAFCA